MSTVPVYRAGPRGRARGVRGAVRGNNTPVEVDCARWGQDFFREGIEQGQSRYLQLLEQYVVDDGTDGGDEQGHGNEHEGDINGGAVEGFGRGLGDAEEVDKCSRDVAEKLHFGGWYLSGGGFGIGLA
jgi:hypothetical protein